MKLASNGAPGAPGNLRRIRAPWAPQLGPQTEAICVTWCPELLYGGAAGGGKSDFLLGDFLQSVHLGTAWRGVLFRRTYGELEELIARSRELYPAAGGIWSASRSQWRFSTGATLKLRYLEREDDALRYQGHQYTWIGWDELGQWASDWSYRYMRARLRSAHNVPHKRIRASANPGGVGHHWIKSYWIEPAPLGYVPIRDDATGTERMFIPSRIQDNQILLASDPGYIGRLRGLGSPELVRAWLDGDWDVVQGAYFPEFSTERHVIAPRELPKHWTRFRSFDWGSARPFAVGWYAMSDGTYLPKGAIVQYREWYGASAPNVGLKLTAEQVADGIKEREQGEKIAYGVADPSIFAEDGGPSHAQRMSLRGITWRRADNTRIPRHGAIGGWDQVRARLIGEDGKPMLYVFSTCRDLIRTLPALQHDTNRPEDVNSDSEDHAADSLRYACMSRPWTTSLKSQQPVDSWDRAFNRDERDEQSWKVA